MSDPTLSDIDFKNEMAWVWSILKDRGVSELLNEFVQTMNLFEMYLRGLKLGRATSKLWECMFLFIARVIT